MSIADVTARIDQIKQQLEVYVGSGATSASATTATAAAFATVLDGAVGRSAGSAAGATATDGATPGQQAVLDQAEKYLGVPYLWGGTDPAKGLDCSGFVQLVYDKLGYDLPRVSRDQARAGRAVEGGLDAAQPGDLLAFGSPVDHIAIYVGDGKMIEAPHRGANVRITDVWDTPVAIRRVLPESSDATAQLAAAQRAFLSTYTSSAGSTGTDALQGLTGTDALSTSRSGYGSSLSSAFSSL